MLYIQSSRDLDQVLRINRKYLFFVVFLKLKLNYLLSIPSIRLKANNFLSF